MAHTPRRIGMILVFSAMTISQGLAQTEPDPAILRGPTVPEQAQRTLVHEGMRSGFQRVEGRPEAAAVRLLGLKPEIMRQVEEVLREHDWAVAMLLVDRIDDVRVISDATIAGDRTRAAELLGSLWQVHDPKRERSPLLGKLAPVLTAEQLAEVTRLVDEYWDAWIAAQSSEMDDMQEEADGPARKARLDALGRRLAFQLFQEEVQQGYELTLRRYREALDAIYAAVEPTDEQRANIRSLMLAYIKDTRLDATPTQRRAVYRAIYQTLDPERQGRLFDYMLQIVVPGD